MDADAKLDRSIEIDIEVAEFRVDLQVGNWQIYEGVLFYILF